MHHRRRGLTTTQIVLIIVGAVVIAGGCFIAMLAAMLIPAIGEAREQAMAIKSQAQIARAMIAAEIVAMERMTIDPNGPAGTDAEAAEAPASSMLTLDLAALVAAGELDQLSLDSPFDRDAAGTDYWTIGMPFDSSQKHPTGPMIVMYDQVMYATHDQVAVGFSDGSSRVVSLSEFEALMRNPTNAQTDFNLPKRATE